MNAARIRYRTKQFWQALVAKPAEKELSQARTLLTSAQWALFNRMQNSEQNHALSVLQALVEQGEENKDLWIAALLHDVGKSRYPLRLWERVMIVLGKALFPRLTQEWGNRGSDEWQAPRGWRRPFIIAERHPVWGAEMAAETGCSPLSVAIIRHHQERLSHSHLEDLPQVEQLMIKLQAVDEES